MTRDGPPPPPGAAARLLFRALGFVFLALGAAGVVLPGLPATPFLLLAVWAFGRGSPEWAARIERHPRWGAPVRAWRERRAVPRRAKVLAVVSMAASWALLWRAGAPPVALLGVGAILACVALWLVTRPSR